MGNDLIDDVLLTLREAGIRCQRGYPAGRMPYLTGPVVAVNLANTATDLTTVAIHIYAPMATGGAKCEDMAHQVVRLMDDLRGVSQVQACRFDSDLGLFSMTILSTFQFYLTQ
jgi:hypothetical protein